VLDVVDCVIITAPAPQAAILLEASTWRSEHEMSRRVALLRTVEYSRCLSVVLRFDVCSDLEWYALLARDLSHPLLWLACENAKGFVPTEGGTILVAQLGHAISCELWNEDDDVIARRATEWIAEILGDGFHVALQWKVTRWRHSQPRNTIDFDAVNPAATRVLVCGDATARGRVHEAYDSGLKAAARILQRV
jgi:predicted NAD/FAD-dependent oxidoreductase